MSISGFIFSNIALITDEDKLMNVVIGIDSMTKGCPSLPIMQVFVTLFKHPSDYDAAVIWPLPGMKGMARIFIPLLLLKTI